jgi:hypothetical protein
MNEPTKQKQLSNMGPFRVFLGTPRPSRLLEKHLENSNFPKPQPPKEIPWDTVASKFAGLPGVFTLLSSGAVYLLESATFYKPIPPQ